MTIRHLAVSGSRSLQNVVLAPPRPADAGDGGAGSDHPGAWRLALAGVMGPAACRGCLTSVHCCLTKLSIVPPVPIRLSPLLPLALALSSAGSAPPALADSTEATCIFSRHDPTIPVQQGPCLFSQRQGNVNVRFGAWAFRFASAEQGQTYTRSNSSEGLRFNREGQYTLQVLWRSAQAVIPKPPGWTTDNVFLGRWQGQSTAGLAVIDVLTVEPNRIRWGNQVNGLCDSDYSVENLPWGRNGRYPDQLVPPSQPTELVFGVARLTLRPTPCSTGDAVIQLAMPLDGSNALEVVTYDAKGEVTGMYGAFQRLPAAGG